MIHATAKSGRPDSTVETSFSRQGSLRRVLPSEHNKDNLLFRHNEEINQFFKVIKVEYTILAEYKMLLNENVSGVYIIPSKESSLVWFGVIFVRSGLYENGIFRFHIFLPENFPDGGHPKVVFESKVYHPVIDSNTNELYLLRGFPSWNKREQHIWQVVKYIHWTLYNVEFSLNHGINEDAIKLFHDDREAFKAQIDSCIKQSLDDLYKTPPTDDKHYIQFEEYVPEIHDPIKSKMINNEREKSSISGHSWVKAGSFKALSRTPSTDSE